MNNFKKTFKTISDKGIKMRRYKIPSLLLLTALLNSACFSMSNNADFSSQAPAPQATPTDGEEPGIIPGLRSLNVVGTTNIMEHMMNTMGLVPANLSNASRAVFAKQAGVFPIAGEVKTITAPSQLAYLELGSEVCNDLITKESVAGATKNFFTGIDLTAANGAASPASIDDAKVKLARAFWGRSPSSEESQIIAAGQSEAALANNSQADRRRILLFLCLAMSTSVDSIEL
jgi:hypothetical protein